MTVIEYFKSMGLPDMKQTEEEAVQDLIKSHKCLRAVRLAHRDKLKRMSRWQRFLVKLFKLNQFLP